MGHSFDGYNSLAFERRALTRNFALRIGGDAETRLQSAVAEQLGRLRQEQLLGQENSEIDFEKAFREYSIFIPNLVQKRGF